MKVEAHQHYQRDKNGEHLPGVTTVLNILNKPALTKWANNLGLRGIDSNRYVSERAEIGTLAHEAIMAYFLKKKVDTSDYSENQIRQARIAVSFFHKWRKIYQVKPILIEKQLVSRIYGYGGTLDLFAELTTGISRTRELVDFKTSKDIFPTAYVQVAAYRQLLVENGYIVDNVRILKIPAYAEQESFDEKQLLHLEKYWTIFKHCLAIYKMRLL